MPSYHHLDSRYARLSPATIDFALEAVRDANEVLVGTEALSAQELLLVARSVLETEQLYEQEPTAFTEPEQPARSDWTLACIAEKFAAAVDHLRERGAPQAAERAQQQGAVLLRRIADSATRSALVDYAHVLQALIEAAPHSRPRERLELQRRYLAEDVSFHKAQHALPGLLAIGISHLQLGQHALAFDIFSEVLRHDPTAVEAHAALAEPLAQDFPELALAAAQRALLLATRDTAEEQRAQLRALIERTRGRHSGSLPTQAASLLLMLQDKPGKRVRTALPALCESLVPELAYVPVKHAEPLPDPQALAALRQALSAMPRPEHTATVRVQRKRPAGAAG